MGYKVQGDTNDGAKVIVIDETTWEVEGTNDGVPSTYEVPCLQVSGTKLVFARRNDGEFIGYGNVSPIHYISNYWGDRSLGSVQFSTDGITQSDNVTDIDDVLSTGNKTSGGGSSSYNIYDLPTSNVYEFTVPNVNGSYDGDMVVAQFRHLTIDENVWVATKQPCRGLFIYVSGNCTINGTLSMKGRGAGTDPTTAGGSDNSAVDSNGIRLPMLKLGSTDTLAAAVFDGCGTSIKNIVSNQVGVDSDGTILTIQRIGASGNPRSWSAGETPPNATWPTPIAATTGQTGGGSGGFSRYHPGNYGTVYGGSGGAGSCFSGGAGGGNGYCNWDCYTGCANGTAGSAQSYGRQGGTGLCQCSSTSLLCCTGGAGNPRGTNAGGNCGSSAGYINGGWGTGGVIWLLVAGDLTIGSNGHINCDGIGSAYASSGGGAMVIAYAGNLVNNGAITADGMSGNAADGSIQQINVSC